VVSASAEPHFARIVDRAEAAGEAASREPVTQVNTSAATPHSALSLNGPRQNKPGLVACLFVIGILLAVSAERIFCRLRAC
jgi:hypothetical protein